MSRKNWRNWGTPVAATDVTTPGKLAARNIGSWCAPLNTDYPQRTRLAILGNANPATQVTSPGQNQAGDPRAMQSGLWKIAALTNNAKLAGQNGAVIGGSTINVGTSTISTPMLIILAGVVMLFIWK